jgi:tetratricopeptide (TPR) repeat protein
MKNIVIILSILVVLVALTLILKSPEDQPLSTDSQVAIEFYQKGLDEFYLLKNDAAILSLKKSISEDPGFAMAHARLAVILNHENNTSESDLHSDIAESLLVFVDSDLEQDKIRLVMAHLKEIGLAEFDSLLDKVVQQAPDDLLVKITKAGVLASRRDNKAVDIYKSIIDENPNFAPAYNMLGYAAAQSGNYQQAEDYFRHYSYLVPDIANSHDSLAELLSWTGRYPEAEQEYLKALDIQSDFLHSLLGIAEINIRQGRVSAATKLLDQLTNQDISNRFQNQINQLIIESCLINENHDALLPAIRSKINAMESKTSIYAEEAIYSALSGNRQESDMWLNKLNRTVEEKGYNNLKVVQTGITNLTHQRNAILSGLESNHSDEVQHWRLSLESIADIAPHEKWIQQWKLGEALLKTDQPGEAAQQAKQILETNPKIFQAWLLFAESSMLVEDIPAVRFALDSVAPLIELIDTGLPARDRFAELTKKVASR